MSAVIVLPRPAVGSGLRISEAPGIAEDERSVTLTAGPHAVAYGRRWIARKATMAGVPSGQCPRLRVVGVELIREAVACAPHGAPILLTFDSRGSTVRIAVEDPTPVLQISHRTEVAVRMASEWGIDWPATGGRRVWCRVSIA